MSHWGLIKFTKNIKHVWHKTFEIGMVVVQFNQPQTWTFKFGCHHYWCATRVNIGTIFILGSNNDISNFTIGGCITNHLGDNAIVYASGYNVYDMQQKLQNCFNNISPWYPENRLKISDKSKVMLVGNKVQLKSLHVYDLFNQTTKVCH